MSGSVRSSISLEPFSPGSPHLEGALDVYVAVFGGDREDARSFVTRYAKNYPHFAGVVALDGGRVVGLGWGAQGVLGNWWYDKVAARVGARHPALQDAWVLVELGVLPEYRASGVGTRVHDAVIAAQPLPRLLLSTQVANVGARRLYERLGWEYLHPGFAFQDGGEPYVVMCREVRAGVG